MTCHPQKRDKQVVFGELQVAEHFLEAYALLVS